MPRPKNLEQVEANLREDVFDFLDLLRSTGIMNMFGATDSVAEAYDLPKSVARDLLTEWMQDEERHKP
jgi:hypothetical protein